MKIRNGHGLIIDQVAPESVAEEVGLLPGDAIVMVDGKPLSDLISLELALASGQVLLTIQSADEVWELHLELDEAETLGVTFRSAVSKVKVCENNCPFCFVRQMPSGYRKGLYLRDDDWRLSFLQGNYITLTNLEPQDWQRLTALATSPLYVSIHTTNPQLRSKLLGNAKAGEIMWQLERLAAAGIYFHGQLVLVPELNDGAELARSFKDLAALVPALSSLAVVPVGLTAFRDGLPAVRAFQAEEAAAVLAEVDGWQETFRRHGLGRYYASDEFFLLAGRTIPRAEYYDDFPQLENGVGVVRQFWDGLDGEISSLAQTTAEIDCQLATGSLALPILQEAAARIRTVTAGRMKIEVVAARSFLGPEVTVAGLISGRDFLQLPADERPLLIPDICLNADGVFLDDLTPGQLQAQLGRKVFPVSATGEGLVEFLKKGLLR